MDQTAGSVVTTVACQLPSKVDASTTPAVTLFSSEPTPIVTCGNHLAPCLQAYRLFFLKLAAKTEQ